MIVNVSCVILVNTNPFLFKVMNSQTKDIFYYIDEKVRILRYGQPDGELVMLRLMITIDWHQVFGI